MKSTFRLSVAILSLCAAPLLRAQGDDTAARRTQAEALLQAMHTEQVLSNATTRVHQMVDRYSQQSAGTRTDLTPEQKDAMKKAQDDANALVGTQLGWDAVKNDFIQAYADAFTEDELKGLVAFYSSPLGQKLVEKQPAVTEKMGHLTQQKMMAAMPAIMAKIKEGAPKPATASPTPGVSVPAPVPATPVAPAVPAVPAVPAAPTTPAATAPAASPAS